MRKKLFLISGFLIVLIFLNYSALDNGLKKFLEVEDYVFIERVIDGDTVVIDGVSSRLLGINSPEKGEKYYLEAKNFLEELVLNKTIRVEKKGKDRYSRDLVYLFSEKENINLIMIQEGLATPYFPSGKDRYYNQFFEELEKCEKNLCEKSKNNCADCVVLEEFDYRNEVIVLFNRCNYNCDLTKWILKDEGRKKFIFPEYKIKSKNKVKIITSESENSDDVFYWKGESYVWTKTGDTLFLRDSENKLVLWENY